MGLCKLLSLVRVVSPLRVNSYLVCLFVLSLSSNFEITQENHTKLDKTICSDVIENEENCTGFCFVWFFFKLQIIVFHPAKMLPGP